MKWLGYWLFTRLILFLLSANTFSINTLDKNRKKKPTVWINSSKEMTAETVQRKMAEEGERFGRLLPPRWFRALFPAFCNILQYSGAYCAERGGRRRVKGSCHDNDPDARFHVTRRHGNKPLAPPFQDSHMAADYQFQFISFFFIDSFR